MRVIVGLGNPGEKYRQTRHNVGFMVVDSLAEQVGDRNDVILVKPQTYMNRSGETVKKATRQLPGFQVADLYVIHDDLDIPLGKFKVQRGKGPKVHRGLQSIYAALGSKDFWHVRVGIENRRQEIAGEEYVLKRFTREERPIIDKVVEEVAQWLGEVGT